MIKDKGLLISEKAGPKNHLSIINNHFWGFRVLDLIPAGVCVIDKDYEVRFWNNCMQDWTGIHKDCIIGSDLGNNFPSFNEPKYRSRIESIFSGGPPIVLSAGFQKDIFPSPLPDGELRNLNTTVTAVPSSGDNGFDALFVVKDITKLTRRIDNYKQTQDQLRESEKKYRAIFENSVVAVMMVDEQERLVSWNKFTEKLLGMNAEDLHLKPVKSLYPDEEWIKIRAHNAREKCLEAHLESRMIRKDAQVIDVDISRSVLRNSEGKIISSVAIINDITERKRLEQVSIRAKKEVEEANRKLEQALDHANILTREAKVANNAKSEFLANMSHEIRTPMNGIVGMLTLALNKEREEKIREYLTIAKTCADNLLNLINDILDISKVEAGKLAIEIIDCNVDEILSVINSSMRPSASEKGIGFEVVLKTDVPEQIKTDPTRLNQCLVNLIGNAVKFTETGGVTVELSLEEMGGKPFVRFDVVDTGIGIPVDQQKSIFDKFMQADSSTTRKHGGTGLGLAITKQLTQLLGGDLTLTSEPGKGSTFSVIIPANIDIASATMISNDKWCKKERKVEASDEINNAAGKVLVVEDDFASQQVILGMLEETNLQAEIANSGIEAVNKVTSGSYDLIFMDIQMPNMNGYDATKTIREKGYTLPIIALTAYAMKGDEEKCLNAGCDAYLPKPVDAEKLFETLSEFLSFESYFMLDKINAAKKEIDELNKQFCNTHKATVKSINSEE